MGKHNLLNDERIPSQQLTPEDIWEDLKRASDGQEPKAAYDILADGERLEIDLDAIPPMSTFVFEGGISQRLRAIITAPIKGSRRHYGLVEVYGGAGQGEKAERRLVLSEMASADSGAHLATALDPIEDAVAEEGTWRSTIRVTPDARFIAVEHEGKGATEVVGPVGESFIDEHSIPAETWALPFGKVQALFSSHR